MTGGDRRRAVERAAGETQRRALEPAASVWVAASAGTGKTKVLIDRVLSLLLAGTAPERILCLTFTKAAAAEMANRLALPLQRWVAGSRKAVVEELSQFVGRRPDDALVELARGLFARVLDAPGGLKILTIHAYCQSLLGRFPLEAGVSPNFQVLDERSSEEMLASAREEVLSRAEGSGAHELAAAVRQVSIYCQDRSFVDLIRELIRERARFYRLLRRHGDAAGLRAALHEALGVDPAVPRKRLLAEACRDQALDLAGLRRVAAAMVEGSKTDRVRGSAILAWLDQPAGRAVGLEAYCAAFFTQAGQVYQRLVTQQVLRKQADAGEVLTAEAVRLEALRTKLRGLAVAEATLGLLAIGRAILAVYQDRKDSRGLLDYDDLILKTRDLLALEGASSWVLYKLDGGLDHILIDEAQDTNPEQWETVAALAEEFFAGAGARDAVRTVFAVGDAKQSIYSFQRADPEAFVRMREHFRAKATNAGRAWDQVDLEVCFRSTSVVLEAVDRVFADAAARAGLLLGDASLHHEAVRIGEAGLVEVWPPVEPGEAPSSEPWSPPLSQTVLDPPLQRLARLIARRIWGWTTADVGEAGSLLESKGRRLRPGDILVLVRRRNDFVEALVRALKELDVPVAGVDRMVLTDQLAIMDLVALGRLALLPEDDLTLATILKGPLFALSEEQLFTLAHERAGSLWAALREKRDLDPRYEACFERLIELRRQADLLRPHELYAWLLGSCGGRQALLDRLGPEAGDPIEEFLSLALSYERDHAPSLEGFLHWLTSGTPEIKRDMEHGQDAVRIMTVHGAKGLQAPVVILPDTLQTPQARAGLLWLADDLIVWPLGKAYSIGPVERALEAHRHSQDREQRRLLYVAMTRAQDRLYVCGWAGMRAAPEDCWYKLVADALGPSAQRVEFDFTTTLAGGWAGPGLRMTTDQSVEIEGGDERTSPLPRVGVLPDWAGTGAPLEPRPPRPLAPSRPIGAEPAVQSPLAGDDGLRFRRGLIIHRLLESLPLLPEARRKAAAEAFVGQPAHALTSEQRLEIVEETLAVINHVEFRGLFGANSRAEVPVVGLLDSGTGKHVVSGQIDRLIVEQDTVSIIDYKSNRPAPQNEDDVPPIYLRQMAVYAALLRPVFPGKTINCYLLWTDGPRLMQLSDVQLAGHAP